jgi:hypothetical protein
MEEHKTLDCRSNRGATQLYLRYDGEIATGTDNHAINLGVRFSW